MIPTGPFAIISLSAVVLIGISFLLALKLKSLMGKGRDTAPIKILMITIAVNGLLGILAVILLYWQYGHDYITYARITNIMLLIIGLILVVSLWRIYKDYSKLIKKYEPGA